MPVVAGSNSPLSVRNERGGAGGGAPRGRSSMQAERKRIDPHNRRGGMAADGDKAEARATEEQLRTERGELPARGARLLVIGGAEDPDEECMRILPRLVEMAGGKSARI